uniref:Uncharacterized protein n=1 Tax=Procambarus clarkii TaxID=6728 RepID=A0A1Z3GD34_PROCL|nr:hypothetical protein [Procambarus clarkii]
MSRKRGFLYMKTTTKDNKQVRTLVRKRRDICDETNQSSFSRTLLLYFFQLCLAIKFKKLHHLAAIFFFNAVW